MRHRVIVALGTNCGEHSLMLAKKQLAEVFENITFTRAMETEPIGTTFNGINFHNALATFSTVKSVASVIAMLKQVEQACGDSRDMRGKGIVVSDIDILKYDGDRFHQGDWEREYIRTLMSETETNS